MRTVFNTREVAHVWAQQNQHEGRNKEHTIFFKDSLIYSYGHHFCIARRLGPGGTVVMTTRTHSPTTKTHVGYVLDSLIVQTPRVYCEDPSASATQNMSYARRHIAEVLERAENLRIRKNTKFGLQAKAVSMCDQANAYLAALPLAEQAGVERIDVSNLDAIRQEMEVRRLARVELEAKQEAEARAEAYKHIALWRSGGKGVYFMGFAPVALRLNRTEGCIETSRGATITLAAARRIWRYVVSARQTQTEHGADISLGHYTMNLVRKDGSIQVGCHDIAYSEIEAMAQQLDWMTLAVEA